MKIFNFIKKHKILLIIFLITIIFFVTFIILFKINPEMFNFKTVTYRRTSVCNTNEIVSDKSFEKNLYEILGTTKYSDRIFVINNFNINSISIKSYKNKPARSGEAFVFLEFCLDNKIKKFKGKYEFINNFVVISVEDNIYLFYYENKDKALIDYNNYVQEGQEKYILS